MFRAIVGSFFSNVFQLSKISKILITSTDRHSFPVIYVFKIICYLKPFLKLMKLMQLIPHTENIYYRSFLDLLKLISFFLSSLKNQYITTTSKIYLKKFVTKQLNWIKTKSLLLIDVSKPLWYLERSDSKNSWTMLCVLL